MLDCGSSQGQTLNLFQSLHKEKTESVKSHPKAIFKPLAIPWRNVGILLNPVLGKGHRSEHPGLKEFLGSKK